MNLGSFQDIPFGDDAAFADFQMSLQINHVRIAQKLFAAGKVYSTYPLIDSEQHNQDWQQNLQIELSSIFSLIPMTGLPDFSNADLSQDGEFQDFMQQLCFVEARVNAQLNIL